MSGDAREAAIENEGILCHPADRCLVCGASGVTIHSDLRDRLFGAPGEWSVRRCGDRACGAGWLDPQPLDDEIGKFYATYYTHEATDLGAAPASGRSSGAKARVKALLAAAMPRRRSQFHTDLFHLEDLPPGRLLEIGCGSGAFLALAARGGWEAHGVDFDAKAIAAANRIPGVQAHVGDLASVDEAAGPFDAIVMNNVLEHLPAPTATFARIHALLRPGGRFVAITPNMAARGHDIFGPDWRGLEIPRHLVLYTTKALLRLSRRAGFVRTHAFSPLSNDMPFIAEMSSRIAVEAGRTPPKVRPAFGRVSGLLALFGIDRGEFIVLVAHRDGAARPAA